MKYVIALFLCVAAALICASFARTLLSVERAQFNATVLEFAAMPGNEAREVPLPGDLTARLSDGRTVRVILTSVEEKRAGQSIRVSERVAPWGETWYRVID